jgi:hypothetical protein
MSTKKRKGSQRKPEKLTWKNQGFDVQRFVVKSKISSILYSKDDKIFTVLQDLVSQTSKLTHEVSYFANAFVAYKLENAQNLDILYSQNSLSNSLHQFYLNCFHVFTSNKEIPEFTSFYNTYKSFKPNVVQRKIEFQKFFEGLSTTKATLARQMATNAKNSFFVALENRIKSVMKYEFYKFNKGKYRILLEKFINKLLNDSTKISDVDNLDLKFENNAEKQKFDELLSRERQILYNGMQKQSIDELESNPHNILNYYKILLQRSDAFAEEKSKNEEMRLPKVKRFSFLPLRSYQLNSILIDTDLLYFMMKRCNLFSKDEKIDKTTFGNQESIYWLKAFDVKRYIKTSKAKKTFAYALHTDGVQVSIHMFRKVPKRNYVSKAKSKSKPKISKSPNGLYFEKQLDQEKLKEPIISVDPGYHVMLQCCEKSYDTKSDESTFRMTRREYENKTKLKTQRQRKENWIKRNDELPKEINSLQFKVPTFTQMQDCLKLKSDIEDKIWDHYGTKRFRNLKFQLHRMKQRTMDRFCNLFTHGSIVAYGSAKFSISKKGDIKVPQQAWISKLSRKCKVVLTSEYFTSKKCFECKGTTKPMEYEKNLTRKELITLLRDKIGEKMLRSIQSDEKRGLRRCETNGCTQFLHRDVNAAKNIGYALWHRLALGERPSYLCRVC